MRRREFVKALVAASVTAPAALAQQQSATPVAPSVPPPVPTAAGPLPWMSGLDAAKPLPVAPLVPDAVAQTNARFFSETELATLRRLCEILLPPAKGYPGATDAEAPEFLDFLIGASPAPTQQMYRSGLDRLQNEAMQHFKLAFSAVDKKQADQLIRPWLRTWTTDHPPTEPYARFINLAHADIRTATVNSQAWSDAAKAHGQASSGVALYWYPVDPDLRRRNAAAAPAGRPKST
jgi:hypothetical protein